MSINLIVHTNRKSPISEAYRTLRTNIQFSSIDNKVKTMAVTSSGPSEGKTTTITNLAETFAQAGNRVIIVDSDLRRPCVHKTYGIEQNEGLTNVLAGQKDLKQVIRISESDVHIITSGPIPPNPSELLGSQKMQELIQVLEEHYDIVLFDAPPVNAVTDAAILSTLVDGIIFVVASGRTEIENGKHAMKSLEAVNANVLGVVMTMIPVSKKGYYGYSYYSYEQDALQSKKKRRFLKTKNR